HVARGAVVAVLALVAALGGGTIPLLMLAALEGILASLHRPSNAALLPALARAPEELVASNVVSGAGENIGSLVGPAVAAGLVALGEQGIGVLQAAIGLGGIAGAVAGSAFAGRRRLSGAMLLGLVLWGLPITVIGLIPNAALAILVLTVLGVGNAIFDVGLFSLIQRNVPNRVRGSGFGVCERIFMPGIARGSLAGPCLVHVARPH